MRAAVPRPGWSSGPATTVRSVDRWSSHQGSPAPPRPPRQRWLPKRRLAARPATRRRRPWRRAGQLSGGQSQSFAVAVDPASEAAGEGVAGTAQERLGGRVGQARAPPLRERGLRLTRNAAGMSAFFCAPEPLGGLQPQTLARCPPTSVNPPPCAYSPALEYRLGESDVPTAAIAGPRARLPSRRAPVRAAFP